MRGASSCGDSCVSTHVRIPRRPSLVTGLHFQRSKLALIGSRGVEIMDLESMRHVHSSMRAQALG